jgi:methylenetetrahydrofolate--tRNA-(uracil-5-)-methyltransferase
MNANFGLVDALDTEVRDKRRKRELLAERALADLTAWRDRLMTEEPVSIAYGTSGNGSDA